MSDLPPIPKLPKLSLGGLRPEQVDASKIVAGWLATLRQAFDKNDFSTIPDIVHGEGYWRDVTALAWDISCKNGPLAIQKYLSASNSEFRPLKAVEYGALAPRVETREDSTFVQSGYTFNTKFGIGVGVVRLVSPDGIQWKAWVVSSVLQNLHSSKTDLESGARANCFSSHNGEMLTNDNGFVANSITADHNIPQNAFVAENQTVPSCSSKEACQKEGLQVIIIGGGHAGLNTAAWCKQVGLRYLLLEKGSRLGQSWWSRYDTVRTHTPSFGDHFAFLKFPTTWPYGLERKRLAGWMEHYADIMELEYQLESPVANVKFHPQERIWSVFIEEPNGQRVLKARHIVFATGVFGPDPMIPNFPGRDSYKGLAYHSSKHVSARLITDLEKKNVAIIGCGTSSHDIAQDMIDHGAKNVCMIQRNPIYSVTPESIATVQFSDWNRKDISLEEADHLGMSWPTPLVRAFGIEQTQAMVKRDAKIIEDLEKSGLVLRKGRHEVSLIDHQAIIGGHYYIDQGADKMIIDGKIKVVFCDTGVKGFYPDGIKLGNGQKVEADIVVLATGFHFHQFYLGRLLGKEILDKTGPLGPLDEDQEPSGLYRPTGLPGFWRMSSSLMGARQYSRILANQIMAVERGWVTDYYDKI
ncbi:hypothetical protein G7054_g13138 [Neopestalotiopsis clavispora]|nr:hypothetical protein G7054_g13138 [Neopestalotiopsis clavispora]